MAHVWRGFLIRQKNGRMSIGPDCRSNSETIRALFEVTRYCQALCCAWMC